MYIHIYTYIYILYVYFIYIIYIIYIYIIVLIVTKRQTEKKVLSLPLCQGKDRGSGDLSATV